MCRRSGVIHPDRKRIAVCCELDLRKREGAGAVPHSAASANRVFAVATCAAAHTISTLNTCLPCIVPVPLLTVHAWVGLLGCCFTVMLYAAPSNCASVNPVSV